MSNRIRVAVLAVIVASVVAVVGALSIRHSTTATKAAGISTDPTSWTLPPLSGEGTVSLAQFRGQPVVVNFFASWCTTCDFELPGFRRVSEDLRGKVTFVGVNSLETGDPNYMPRRHGLTGSAWYLARDVGGTNGNGLHTALGGRGMPLTVFYDADGRIADRFNGGLPEAALRQWIQKLYGIST